MAIWAFAIMVYTILHLIGKLNNEEKKNEELREQLKYFKERKNNG